MVCKTTSLSIAITACALVLQHLRQHVSVQNEACNLVAFHNQLAELITDCRDADDFGGFEVVEKAADDADVIAVRHEESVKHCLCAVLHGFTVAPGLEFEGEGEGFFGFAVGDDGLDGGVDVAFEAVEGGPDVLFDVEEFVDGDCGVFFAAVVNNSSVGLYILAKEEARNMKSILLVSLPRIVWPNLGSGRILSGHILWHLECLLVG